MWYSARDPRAHNDFFWSPPVLGRKILRKSQSASGPTQCKPGSGNNMVSRIVHFSITIHLHLASFYAIKYFKKKQLQ